MNAANNDNSYINRPTSPAALRLEAARARAGATEPGRTRNERVRDLRVSKAFEGLAENREYLDRQEQPHSSSNRKTI
jgi:hypothetical protein